MLESAVDVRYEHLLAQRRRLAAALPNARACQQRVLESAPQSHVGTAYGVAHDFASVRGYAEFAAAVPIHDYAALAPWIERAAAGEPNVLTADEPLVFFTSSWSTGAQEDPGDGALPARLLRAVRRGDPGGRRRALSRRAAA